MNEEQEVQEFVGALVQSPDDFDNLYKQADKDINNQKAVTAFISQIKQCNGDQQRLGKLFQDNQEIAGRLYQLYKQVKSQSTKAQYAKFGTKMKESNTVKTKKLATRKMDEGGYNKTISAPGDTTETKRYKYRIDTKQTYPNGSAIYTTTEHSGSAPSFSFYDPRRVEPTFWQKFINWAWNPASPEMYLNYDQISANHANDTANTKDKTKK